jgi:hypothetical protein
MAVALSAHALTTVQAVKDELSLGAAPHADDDFLARKINVYSRAIERHCARHFEREAIVGEKHHAEGGLHLVLERRPIVSVAAVSFDGAALTAVADYEIEDAEAGLLRIIHATINYAMAARNITGDALPGTSRKLYAVSYTGGWVLPKDDGTGNPAAVRDLPEDVEEACILAVVTAYAKKGRDRTVQAESLLSHSVTYAGGVSGLDALPPESAKLLEPYRRIIV